MKPNTITIHLSCWAHCFYADSWGEEGKFTAFPILFHEYKVFMKKGMTINPEKHLNLLIGNVYHDSIVLDKKEKNSFCKNEENGIYTMRYDL